MPSWEDVFQNELVQLLCYGGSIDWSFIWYRNGVQLQKGDAGEWAVDDPFLNITAAKEHEGEYSCSLTLDSRAPSSQRSNTAIIKVYGKPLYFTQLSSFGYLQNISN